MQLALVNNDRVEAFSGGRGLCPICGSEMIAKCGPRILHHWAHYRPKGCDPWWENETPWHRDWKNLFPMECREVSHIAHDGEIHRADIKTPTGIVIEVQHSSMTDAERTSREEFYGNLVWVVDGSGFRQNFDIYHELPAPNSELAKDLIWAKAKRHHVSFSGGMFCRLSEARQENPNITKAEVRSGRVYGIREIRQQVHQSYNGYHQYDWVRPRKTWLDAQCPVYIDFGDDCLVKLEIYDESGLACIRYVSKRKFVHDAMVETHASAIATRSYPLPKNVP
jgi:hypothetical protein